MKHKYAPIYNDPQEDDFDEDYNGRIDEEAEERGMEDYYENKFKEE